MLLNHFQELLSAEELSKLLKWPFGCYRFTHNEHKFYWLIFAMGRKTGPLNLIQVSLSISKILGDKDPFLRLIRDLFFLS